MRRGKGRVAAAVAALLIAVAVIAGLWQPPAGDGWRLLALVESGGKAYGVGVATSATELRALLPVAARRDIGPVDFGEEFVVHFAAVASSGGLGCARTILQEVHIDGAAVFGAFRKPWWTTYCNDDARYRGFLVAVRRDAVPPGPVTVRLTRERWCVSCDETETVTVHPDPD